MKRLPKGFYVTALAGMPAVIFGIYFLRGLLGTASAPMSPAAALALVVLFLATAVVTCMLIYRMWASIQDGHARTTPGKAVGFLFIPFFGAYWIFQVLCGFAKDYNAHVERVGLHLPKLNKGLFLTCILLYFAMGLVGGVVGGLTAVAATTRSAPALAVVGIISVFYVAIAATSYGLWVTVVVKICNAVNALPSISRKAQPAGPQREGLALYCARGEFAGNAVPLPDEGIVIGRSPARAHLVLASPSISAAHVQVWPDHSGSGVWVKDMESTNGTFYLSGHASAQPSEWLPLRAPKLLARHAHFRLAEDGAEFEVR